VNRCKVTGKSVNQPFSLGCAGTQQHLWWRLVIGKIWLWFMAPVPPLTAPPHPYPPTPPIPSELSNHPNQTGM